MGGREGIGQHTNGEHGGEPICPSQGDVVEGPRWKEAGRAESQKGKPPRRQDESVPAGDWGIKFGECLAHGQWIHQDGQGPITCLVFLEGHDRVPSR